MSTRQANSNQVGSSSSSSLDERSGGSGYWDSAPLRFSQNKTLNYGASESDETRNASASTIATSADSSSSSLRPLTRSYSSSTDIPLLKKEDSDSQLKGSQSNLLGSQGTLTYTPNAEKQGLATITEKGGKEASTKKSKQDGPRILSEKEQKRKTLYLSFCFAVLFSAFNPAQSFVTTVHADIGFYSLAIIYSCFAIGCLLAPSVGQYIKVKNAMFFGALTYIGFLFGLCQSNTIVILVLSAVNGFGSGFMWLYQGVWFSRISEHGGSVGKLSGIFFSVFSLNSVIGNLIVIGVSLSGVSMNVMLLLLTGIGAVGACMYFFSGEIPSATGIPKPVIPLKQQLASVVAVAKRKDTMLFSAYMINQGFAVAFNNAKYPTMVGSSAVDIGIAFLVYGVSSVISSYIAGKVYDRFSWKPLAIAQALLTALVGFISVYSVLVGVSLYGMFALGFVLGVVDNITNCLLNTAIVKNYDNSVTTYVYAYYRCLFCVGFSAAAVFAGFVGTIMMACVYSAIGLLSIVLLAYVIARVWAKTTPVMKEIITTSPEQSTSNTDSEESTNSQTCEEHPVISAKDTGLRNATGTIATEDENCHASYYNNHSERSLAVIASDVDQSELRKMESV